MPGVLDPILISDIFTLQNWILMNLKPMFPLETSQPIWIVDKMTSFYRRFQNSCARNEVKIFN